MVGYERGYKYITEKDYLTEFSTPVFTKFSKSNDLKVQTLNSRKLRHTIVVF